MCLVLIVSWLTRQVEFFRKFTVQVGLGVGLWPNNRTTWDRLQVNSIILRDFTQECREEKIICTDITV